MIDSREKVNKLTISALLLRDNYRNIVMNTGVNRIPLSLRMSFV